MIKRKHKVGEWVGSADIRGYLIEVYRDADGKFWVINNDKITQRRLVAKEIVCYLLNAAQDKIPVDKLK